MSTELLEGDKCALERLVLVFVRVVNENDIDGVAREPFEEFDETQDNEEDLLNLAFFNAGVG